MDEREPMVSDREEARVAGRPFGVAIVAGLQAAHAIAAAVAVEVPAALALPGPDALGPSSPAAPLVVLGGLIIAGGLWLLHRWAWTATMLWVGATMALALYAYFAGEPQYPVMIVSVAIALYLNQRGVRAAFAPGPDAAPGEPAAGEAATEPNR